MGNIRLVGLILYLTVKIVCGIDCPLGRHNRTHETSFPSTVYEQRITTRVVSDFKNLKDRPNQSLPDST